jgi:hypothetical protein
MAGQAREEMMLDLELKPSVEPIFHEQGTRLEHEHVKQSARC